MFFVKGTEHIARDIITTPVLFEQATDGLIKPEEWHPQYPPEYWIIADKEGILGMFVLRHVSNQTVDVHIYILPKYQGTFKSFKAGRKFIKWFAKNANQKKAMVRVPATDRRINLFVDRIGFKECGRIPDGIVWQGQLTDLIFKYYDLTGVS